MREATMTRRLSFGMIAAAAAVGSAVMVAPAVTAAPGDCTTIPGRTITINRPFYPPRPPIVITTPSRTICAPSFTFTPPTFTRPTFTLPQFPGFGANVSFRTSASVG